MNPERLPRLDPRLEQRLATKKAQLDQYRPLPQPILRRIHDDLRVTLTYHSTGIEGNTLSLRETQLVIEHGITVGGHSLHEHLEVTNHARAFDWLIDLAGASTPFTIEVLCELHRLVLGNEEGAGMLREGAVSIRGAHHVPPPARALPALLQAWFEWLDNADRAVHPIVYATIAHHGFEYLHPFRDGNGRTGRLVLNLLLLRAHYPPALLLQTWRLSYLNGLAAADRGDARALATLIGRAVERGLDLYLDACAAEPDSLYQPLSVLAQETGYRAEHLGWLIRKGRLAAIRRQGRWFATREAVERYRAEVAAGTFPRGRPPKPSKSDRPEEP